MNNRRTQEIKERYLKRISLKVLETIEIINSLVDEGIRNKLWFIEWKDNLNKIII